MHSSDILSMHQSSFEMNSFGFIITKGIGRWPVWEAKQTIAYIYMATDDNTLTC